MRVAKTSDQRKVPAGKHLPGTGSDDTGTRARWFWPALVGICLAGGVVRLLIFSEYISENPFAKVPRVDALTYWNWAGRIAAGQLREPTPFFSAPLYPYLVGLIRACGGSMTTVYLLQVLSDLLTAVLLGWIGRARFGDGVGLLAGGLFLLMLEPASFCLRILTCSLQLLLICLTWMALLTVQQRPSWAKRCLSGACLGLLSLSYPPAMLLVPALGLWLWWNSERGLRDCGRAVVPVFIGVVIIAPVTLHNYLTSGSFFAIQSAVGINFRQGNGPGAAGTITMIPGTSIDREMLFSTAQAAFLRETGRTGSWKEINGYYRDQALAYWRSNLWRTAQLFARKGYWFLTGRYYADIYNPEWEIDDGLTPRLRLAPLRTSWLALPALLAIAALLCKPNRYAPELALFGVPLLIVTVFWFSPRYRLPAIPVMVVAAAWALRQAVRWRERPRWSVAVIASLLLAVGLGVINRVTGFDSLGPFRPQFQQSAGVAFAETGQLAKAVRCYGEALRESPDLSSAHAALGMALVQQKNGSLAIRHLQRAVELEPENPTYHDNLGNAWVGMQQLDKAMVQFAEAVYYGPGVSMYHSNLGSALFQSGELSPALEHYEVALDLEPTSGVTHLNLALLYQRMGREDDALDHYELALRYDPTLATAHYRRGLILLSRGQTAAALEALHRAHRFNPGNITFADSLAWHLATIPDADLRDPVAALRLARQTSERAGEGNARLLDTLAAALATNGRFDQAVITAERALALATLQQLVGLADNIRQRLTLYRNGRPFLQSAEP